MASDGVAFIVNEDIFQNAYDLVCDQGEKAGFQTKFRVPARGRGGLLTLLEH